MLPVLLLLLPPLLLVVLLLLLLVLLLLLLASVRMYFCHCDYHCPCCCNNNAKPLLRDANNAGHVVLVLLHVGDLVPLLDGPPHQGAMVADTCSALD